MSATRQNAPGYAAQHAEQGQSPDRCGISRPLRRLCPRPYIHGRLKQLRDFDFALEHISHPYLRRVQRQFLRSRAFLWFESRSAPREAALISSQQAARSHDSNRLLERNPQAPPSHDWPDACVLRVRAITACATLKAWGAASRCGSSSGLSASQTRAAATIETAVDARAGVSSVSSD
eukprot:6204373-Pleurochrysis_carterae.AAC.2